MPFRFKIYPLLFFQFEVNIFAYFLYLLRNPTRVKSELIPHEWERVTKKKMHYLNIGETLEPDTDPDKDRMKFWEELYSLSGSGTYQSFKNPKNLKLIYK